MHQHRASIAQRFTGRFTGPSGGRVSPTEGRVLGPAHVVAGRLWCGAPPSAQDEGRSPRLASGTQDPVKWVNISDHWYKPTVCSAEMLPEALAACAGATLKAVATALEPKVQDARITAEGDLDLKGTLGIEQQALVGCRDIRHSFDFGGDLTDEQLATLIKLKERTVGCRDCVVHQIRSGPPLQSIRAQDRVHEFLRLNSFTN